MRNLSLGRRHLVNAYEVEAGIGVIAANTVWSMPERLECEVLQKARYINTLTSTSIVRTQEPDCFLRYRTSTATRNFTSGKIGGVVFGASRGFKMVLCTELSDNLCRRYMRSTECPSSWWSYVSAVVIDSLKRLFVSSSRGLRITYLSSIPKSGLARVVNVVHVWWQYSTIEFGTNASRTWSQNTYTVGLYTLSVGLTLTATF